MAETNPGFTVEPAAIINMIRENLVDKYRDAYSIVKELAQNSDDAKARRLELGWCDGLGTAATHPLLRGPAVFLVNDGPFDASNATAIRRIYLSSKSNRRDSIGQFGLGMKSVFHLCEAFFYAWSSPDAQQAFSGAEVLNPWGVLCHPQWNEFRRDDQRLLRQRLAPFIDGQASLGVAPSPSWFALWLPLRLREHSEGEGDLIFPRFYGRSPENAGLFDPALLRDIPTLIPLLRHLETLRVWRVRGGEFERVFEAALKKPARRCGYREGMSYGDSPLGGMIGVNGRAGASAEHYTFAGTESYVEDGALRRLIERPDWPRIETSDARGMPVAVRRKAEPHAAACFVGRNVPLPGAPGRDPTLRIRHSVFLPLQPENDELAGIVGDATEDYILSLHGWFFVDSGRQKIDLPGAGHIGGPEPNIRHEWNQRLLECGTLPLVIPAMEQLARSIGGGHPELVGLTKRMMESDFFASHRRSICGRSQWVLAFGREATDWRVVPAGAPVLVLPGGTGAQSVAWRTLGGLDELTTRAVVTFADAPRLCATDSPEDWSVADVTAALRVDIASVCRDPDALAYCASFVSGLAGDVVAADAVQAALVSIVRGALHTMGAAECVAPRNKPLRTAMTRLMERVDPARYVGIEGPRGLEEETGKALTNLSGEPGGLLAVPSELLVGRERGTIRDVESATTLIRAISAHQEHAEKGVSGRAPPPLGRAFAWIARTVIVATRDDALGGLVERIEDVKLFPAATYQSGSGTRRLSIAEMRRSHAAGELFSGVPKYAKHLQAALPDVRLYGLDPSGLPIVDEEVQVRLLGGERVSSCDTKLCTRLLRSARVLSIDANARQGLFEALIRGDAEQEDHAQIVCLRYLLHNQRALLEQEMSRRVTLEALLVDEDEGGLAWRVLLDAAMARRGDHWRRLPTEICRKLNREQMQKLGISRVDRNGVVAVLSAMQGEERRTVFVEDEEARRELLRSWPESHLALLADVPLHRETGTKKLVALDQHTFLRGSYQLPAELGGALSITLVEGGPEYEYWSQRGKPLAETFGLDQAVREVLRAAERHKYWKFVLDALGRLGASCSDETADQVRSTPWVPAKGGVAVSPCTVVSIPALDEVLPGLLSGHPHWRAWRDVDSAVRQHPQAATLVQRCLETREAAEALCGYLAEQESYQIGEVRLDSSEAFRTWLEALHPEAGAMPTVRVAAGLAEELGPDEARALVTRLLSKGALTAHRLRAVLTALRLHHAGRPSEARGPTLSIYNQYLGLVVRQADAVSILTAAELLNQQGRWTPCESLCLDSPGVSKAALLDPEQEAILRGCLRGRARTSHPDITPELEGDGSTRTPPSDGDLERTLQHSTVRLEQYFSEWGRWVSPNALGGLFAFLGDHGAMVELAAKYLRPRSLNDVRRRIAWSLSEVLFNDGTRGTRPEQDSIEALMGQRRFVVDVVADKTTIVPNLFGDPIRVNLSQDFEHVVLHHSTTWVGGPRWSGVTRLQLRRVPPEQLREANRARELLEGTLAWVLETVFRQRPSKETLAEIVDPDRDLGALNIRIAQNILLDALPVYLQQISYRGTGEVKEYLDKWNRATYAKAEAELELEKSGGPHSAARAAMESAERDHRRLRESMRQVLLDDASFQRDILESVRHKMRVAQYSTSSIPFELFQNADDAVAEWEQMRGEAAPLTPAHRRFVVAQEQDAVTFLHWGRPVNRARLGEFDGSTRRYQDDLLKMLTIAASDKSAEESRAITTGRFGYGFKSAFLLSVEPWVVSGRLGVRIVAGFYPDELDDKAFGAVREASGRWSTTTLEGDEATAVHLRYSTADGQHGKAFERFSRLAPLLPVFSRKIDRVVLQSCEGAVRELSWQPKPVAGVGSAAVGSVSMVLGQVGSRGAGAGREGRCIVLEVGPREDPARCQLLLALDGGGIGRIADDVPTVWVTAPTQECCRLGFAFNAPFEPHIARESLAPDSKANEALVRECGSRLAGVLLGLFDKGAADWDGLRKEFGLDEATEPYGFWRSVWGRLAESVPESTGGSHAGRLMRDLLWGDSGAMKSLVEGRAALPTGLPDTDPMDGRSSYQRLVRLDEPEALVDGWLAEDRVFLEVGYWKGFGEKWPPGRVLHPRVGALLGQLLGGRAPRLARLRLVDVVENELDAGRCAPPAVAVQMASVVSPEFVRESRARDARTAVEEDRQLEELLQSVQFRGRDGGWHPAASLVVGNDPSDERTEDRRRAAIAPAEHVLDTAYESAALPFFYACRYGQGIKAETVAQWIARDDLSDEQRKAALVYLAKSSDADRVGQCVQGLGRTWLSELSRSHALFEGMERKDVAVALQRGGAWEWDQFVRGEYQPPAPPASDEEPLPSDAVLRVAAWWRRQGESHLARYYKRLFPEGRRPELFVSEVLADPPILKTDEVTRRRGWMTLLLIGALQSMGRTRPEQHRGFVEKCLSRGWLDTFSSPPHLNAERWLGLLNEYFDLQLDDQEYLLWMSLYPRIYQFSHWLHQYAWWFKILDHQERVGRHDLLSPRVSPIGEGTEVDAPPLTRSLGMGLCLVVRELVRSGYLRRPELWGRYCYTPASRVRSLSRRLGLCDLAEDDKSGGDRIEHSEALHDALATVLTDPTFGGVYDIPLQVLAEDEALLQEAMRETPLPKR